MSINKKLVTATAAVSMALGVCLYANHSVLGDDNNNNSSQNEDQTKMEQKFFRAAASDNNTEIRLAKLAQERSTDDQVKRAAQMMQSDHEQANQLLFQIADQNHIDVSKDEMNDVDKAEVDMLKSEENPEVFTHMYVFGQVGDHARDELILAYHANNGKSQATRQYSTQVLPKIQMHLHMLEGIARPMAGLPGQAEPAAERERVNGQNQ